MNNEPVAWMLADKEAKHIRSIMAVQHDFVPQGCVEIPLYTHPVKPAICVGHWDYKTGAFHKVLTEFQKKRVDEGFLHPVYTAGMLRVKELTDEEIKDVYFNTFNWNFSESASSPFLDFARAILRKAGE